jgi:hypothetical protein
MVLTQQTKAATPVIVDEVRNIGALAIPAHVAGWATGLAESLRADADALEPRPPAVAAGVAGPHPVAAAGEPPTRTLPTVAALTHDHETILRFLSRAPFSCKLVHEVTSAGPIRNRETAGRLLRELDAMGLVHRPHGARKGYTLTDAGRARASDAPPT